MYENLIILEVLKKYYNSGRQPDIYFYRDTHGNEIDLIIRKQRRLIPIEIKSSATFTKDFLKGIKRFSETTGKICEPGYIFYNGAEEFNINGTTITNILKNNEPDKLSNVRLGFCI